jgi:hypothetical protein
MSAPELRAQVDKIIDHLRKTQILLKQVDDELTEAAQELLALDAGGSQSMHVASANRLLPSVLDQLRQVPFNTVLLLSEMLQYRGKI